MYLCLFSLHHSPYSASPVSDSSPSRRSFFLVCFVVFFLARGVPLFPASLFSASLSSSSVMSSFVNMATLPLASRSWFLPWRSNLLFFSVASGHACGPQNSPESLWTSPRMTNKIRRGEDREGGKQAQICWSRSASLQIDACHRLGDSSSVFLLLLPLHFVFVSFSFSALPAVMHVYDPV